MSNRKTLGLPEKLAAIGILAASSPLTKKDIDLTDIEDTLVEAAIEITKRDGSGFWLLSPVLSWIKEHGTSVIIEKLIKIAKARAKSAREDVSALSLFGSFADSCGHKRWHKLQVFAPARKKQPRTLGHDDLAISLVHIRGEEPWAKGSGFLVPKGSTEINSKWILSRESLAKLNRQYRNRLIYGAQWRADIVTAIENGAKTPTEASRMSGASYEPCHRVMRELETAGVIKIAS